MGGAIGVASGPPKFSNGFLSSPSIEAPESTNTGQALPKQILTGSYSAYRQKPEEYEVTLVA